jgi:membrane fusion protein, multidrug efflux system
MNAAHFPVFLLAVLCLSGCGKKAPAGPPQMPPAAVTVAPVVSEPVNVSIDLPGRIHAIRTAEVRARVPGILLHQTFVEGAEVKADETLFKIDPAPLEAALARAKAALAVATATRDQAASIAVRYEKLADSKAVSHQEAENAANALKVAEAEVLSAEAGVKTAELNLSYATVTAPISGRIGKAQVTEGALVGQGDATRLAVIQQLDPVHLDFTQSANELNALKRSISEGKLEPFASPKTTVKLLLDDGTEYAHPGKVLFSEVTVDPSTGMVALRAEFPNPDRLLLPGMFARIRISLGAREPSLTVLQRAVTRAQGGAGSVFVVGENKTVELRMIHTSSATGDKWIVTDGLKAGESVIIEGHLKAHPGATVVPSPFVPSNKAGKS